MTNITNLPIELFTIITTQDLETFQFALKTPSIGFKLCCEYVQNYAKSQFISVVKTDTSVKYYLCGKLHRSDGPAAEYSSGTKVWYRGGKFHREDGPALEHANGNKYWYWCGELHRDNGPAVEHSSGNKRWYQHGKFHHSNNNPIIEYNNNHKE